MFFQKKKLTNFNFYKTKKTKFLKLNFYKMNFYLKIVLTLMANCKGISTKGVLKCKLTSVAEHLKSEW